jgi:23S rRNA pseudouridine2605 synthase
MERLQKYLARCGVASRRRAEEIVRAGRVAVNGVVITQMGTQIDPERDQVQLDGRLVRPSASLRYLALHKPPGVVSTVRDDRGRRTVLDLAEIGRDRLYPVGRLDYESEGLVLLTNDGELAARLMHPRYNVSKVYRVWVAGCPTQLTLQRLAAGVRLSDGITRPAGVRVRRLGDVTELELEIREGRNRQIRRMCDTVGHEVLRLQRVRIGPLSLGALPPSRWRDLEPAEVTALRRATGLF